MKNFKSEKGITLVSLIMYIILTAIILAILSVISISFRNNLSDMNTETMQNSEFDKINIQLIKETKIEDNYIDTANSTDTKIVFTNGNTYTYVSEDKAIYLNNYIKVAENIESYTYKYTEANDKLKLTVTVKINGIQRILEYTFIKDISEEYSLWDGESSEPPVLIGANWYIYNAKQFKFFADYVNSAGTLTEEQESQVIKAGYDPESLTISDTTTVYLMRNLDLGARVGPDGEWGTADDTVVEWTPIGPEKASKFTGTFEGNDYIISGVYVSKDGKFSGIFGNSDTIKNLTVTDSYIKSTDNCTGGIVGALREGNLINCHNINTQVYGGGKSTGGIVGQFTGDKIENCSNKGDIISIGTSNNESVVGGIVGLHGEGIVENCENSGTVTAEKIRCGGISGETDSTARIIKCKNAGTISGETYVGGITGALYGTIEKSYNEGQITGTATDIGGICGAIGSDATVTIQNTYNKGKVIAGVNATECVGGIIGIIDSSATATIKNNYNRGDIIIKGTTTTNYGGAIAYKGSSASLTLANNYYLSGVVKNEAGETIDENGSYRNGTPKTDSEMKLQAFVDELNEGLEEKAWVKTNEYPALIGM